MPLLKWKLLNLVSFYGESDGGDVCDYEEGLEEGFDQVLIWFGTGEEANQRRRKKKMKKAKKKMNEKSWKKMNEKIREIWKRKKVDKLWKIKFESL